MSKDSMLNIGCGATFHPAWVNIDMNSPHENVRSVNILKGIPFPDSVFKVVYSSHVLEHLGRQQAEDLLRECGRVLSPGGVIRLVLPDLEVIVREYIRLLDGVVAGKKELEADYQWIVMELLDQLVRGQPGGEMGRLLKGMKPAERDYVRRRLGREADSFWVEGSGSGVQAAPRFTVTPKKFIQLAFSATSALRRKITGMLIYLVGGRQAYDAFHIGLFRTSGEVHQWMYDRFSIRLLLERVGFSDVRILSAFESQIPEFSKYSLDAINGEIRKPDSFFIEAKLPETREK
ncbi:MAG: methyltransferase domain-containing protein [Pseudomonadota bacterium]